MVGVLCKSQEKDAWLVRGSRGNFLDPTQTYRNIPTALVVRGLEQCYTTEIRRLAI